MLPLALETVLLSMYPLEIEVFAELSLRLKEIKIKKKEILLREIQVHGHLYFVENGFLRSYYTESGTEITTSFLKENDFIIFVKSFFDLSSSCETIEALEDCTLYYIPHSDLINLYQKHHSFTIVGLMITQRYYKNREDRLINLLKKDAFERYQYLLKKHPEITLRTPLKHIASYLGISFETLSRIRGRRI